MTEQSPEQKLVGTFRRLAEKNREVRGWVLDVDHCGTFFRLVGRASPIILKVMEVKFPLFTFIYDPNKEGALLEQLEDTLRRMIEQRLSGKKVVIRIDEKEMLSANAVLYGQIPFKLDVEGGDAWGFEPLPRIAAWQFFIPDSEDQKTMLAAIRKYYASGKPTPCSSGACGMGGGMSG